MEHASSGEIIISEKMTIRTIADACDRLREEFLSKNPVVMNVDAVTEFDISFVQLVEAARIQAKSTGIPFSLASPADGGLLAVLKRGGFLDVASSEDRKFWLHREAV